MASGLQGDRRQLCIVSAVWRCMKSDLTTTAPPLVLHFLLLLAHTAVRVASTTYEERHDVSVITECAYHERVKLTPRQQHELLGVGGERRSSVRHR